MRQGLESDRTISCTLIRLCRTQVGRAGRDGKLAHAMLVLDRADYLKLRSLSHKGAAELTAVERLCERVFASLKPLQEQVGVRGG